MVKNFYDAELAVIDGADIGFFVTGVARGRFSVILDYATATRTDSVKLTIVVVDALTC